MLEEDIISWLSCGSCIALDQNLLLIGWGERVWSTQPQFEKPSFYAPEFFLDEKTPWFTHQKTETLPIDELVALLLPYKCDFTPSWNLPSIDIFEKSLIDLRSLFADGKLHKAVAYASQTTDEAYNAQHRASTLSALLQKQKNFAVYTYGFWDNSEGILGATPEVLFSSTRPSVVHTMACAGTQDCKFPVCELEEDAKIGYEHQCVVDGICEALSPFGKVVVKERKVVELARLRHLVTAIDVVLAQERCFEDIVRALHPTPALGAHPRDFGEVWLREYNEVLPRGRYGAPFGVVNQNMSKCYVAIRNVQWNHQGLAIFAGCGIVPGSDPEQECRELCLKIESIKESL